MVSRASDPPRLKRRSRRTPARNPPLRKFTTAPSETLLHIRSHFRERKASVLCPEKHKTHEIQKHHWTSIAQASLRSALVSKQTRDQAAMRRMGCLAKESQNALANSGSYQGNSGRSQSKSGKDFRWRDNIYEVAPRDWVKLNDKRKVVSAKSAYIEKLSRQILDLERQIANASSSDKAHLTKLHEMLLDTLS